MRYSNSMAVPKNKTPNSPPSNWQSLGRRLLAFASIRVHSRLVFSGFVYFAPSW